MELKHIDKSIHSSASKISAGSVDGGLVSSSLTLGRAGLPPAEYEPARPPPPPAASLDRRYAPAYVAMTGVGVGIGMSAGCTSTCERRRHMPDQSAGALSPQSSLGSLHPAHLHLPAHPPPAPCGSGSCPLGSACSASVPVSHMGTLTSLSNMAGLSSLCGGGANMAPGSGSDVYATALSARERGHYVAYEPLGHYTHRDSVSSEAGAGGAATSGSGSLPRGGAGARGAALHSFTLDNSSEHSTPSHSKAGSARDTSPYKKSASSSPGHAHNRLQLGGSVAHCSSELEPLTPSRSTERLHRDMQNLEGLMKDLSAITQQQFHC
ncbi:uncharacterized protein LOC126975392 [Leptidea sinapis]|uniref:uncharacterized protein LOC126975392 n=1 Tax=Leptidea sinapis TaxID=189913 RepID=UPI0021C48F4E|nr:uncharacterized protein LOC126975392 [Leptidea sinapis]